MDQPALGGVKMTGRRPTDRRADQRGSSESTPPEVVSTPNVVGPVDNMFIWQQLGDIQKTLGALQASVETLKETTTSTKSKVQDLSDLRHKIIGGLAVLGVVVTLASGAVVWAANRIWTTFGALAEPALEQSLRHEQADKPPALMPQNSPSKDAH